MKKNIITYLLFVFVIILLWIMHSYIRRNSFPTSQQHIEIRRLVENISSDSIVRNLFESQTIEFKDINYSWKKGKLFLYIYTTTGNLDIYPILERIKKIASSDDYKSLGKTVAIQFYYGVPAIASEKPFAKYEIILHEPGNLKRD